MEVPAKRSRGALELLLGDVYRTEEESSDMSVLQQIQHENVIYSCEKSAELSDDPLLWWNVNSHKFPYLSKLAAKVLVVQGTSVASERIFSTAGNIKDEKRNRLDGETVNHLLFLNKNKRLMK